MWFAPKRFERSLLLALALGVVSGSSHASPERWDPTLPASFSLERARTGSRESRTALPENPEVSWRVRVAGGVPFPPTATAQGSVVLSLTTPVVAEYDQRGRLLWTARLGASSAATSPVVLGDGTRLVLTQAGEAIAFSARGEQLRRVSLPTATLETPPLVNGTLDGGLLIATGRRLVRLDASLGLVSSVRAESDLRALLPGRQRSLVVTSNGSVLELTSMGSLRRLGGFVGRVDAVAQPAPDRLLAVVDGRRLMELDLVALTSTTRFAETDVDLLPLLPGNVHGTSRLVTNLDFLVAFTEEARESFRVALPVNTPGARTQVTELALDDAGTALIARSGVDVMTARADGSLTRVEGTACAEPLTPVGAAPGYAVFACRSGIVLGLSERARAKPH